MRGINKVILVGNIGADPETTNLQSGGVVATISVATTEQWRDKQTGERTGRTEWHRVVLFGKLGEIAGQYLHKGSQVYIEGRLQTRKWQDQSGQDRYTTEVVAQDLQMLGARPGSGEGAHQAPQPAQAVRQPAPQGAPPQGWAAPAGRAPQQAPPRPQGNGRAAPAYVPPVPAYAGPDHGYAQFDDDIPF